MRRGSSRRGRGRRDRRGGGGRERGEESEWGEEWRERGEGGKNFERFVSLEGRRRSLGNV